MQLGDTILGLQKWTYFDVATGPFVNRNSFATLLAMGTVLTLAQAAARLLAGVVDKRARDSSIVLYLVGYGIIVVALLATQSRMGLLAMTIGSLVVALVTARRLGWSRTTFMLMLATLALGLGVTALYGQGAIERLARTDMQLDGRADLFAQVWQLIMQRPWTGFGGGSFADAFTLVHRLPVDPNLIWERAHSSYLNLWTESGLVFGTLPMLAITWCGWIFLRAALTGRANLASAAGGLGVVVVAAVHSVADFSLEVHGVAVIFVAIMAACSAGVFTGENRK